MNNVPLIIPLLEKEYRSATRRMNEINQELRSIVELKSCSLNPINSLFQFMSFNFAYTDKTMTWELYIKPI